MPHAFKLHDRGLRDSTEESCTSCARVSDPRVCERVCERSLKARGSRLVLLRGPPVETIARACKEWGITRLCWEADTEPYAVKRDRDVRAAAESAGIAVESPVGHTLYDSAALIKVAGGKAPSSMKVFSFSMYTAAIAIDAIDVTLLGNKQQAHVCISFMMMSCEWTLPLRLGEALHIAFGHFGGRGPVAIDVTAVCVHQGFEALAAKAGAPAQPLPDPPQQLPAVHPAGAAADTSIPSAQELGYSGSATSAFKVGKQQQASKGQASPRPSVRPPRCASVLCSKAWWQNYFTWEPRCHTYP